MVNLNFLMNKTVVAPYQRAFRMKDQTVQAVLQPGVYWTYPLWNRDEIRVFSTVDQKCDYVHMDTLAATQPELVERYFDVANLLDTQAALVYINDKLSDLLAPGTQHYYWKDLADVRIEVIDLDQTLRVDSDVANLLSRNQRLRRGSELLGATISTLVGEQQVAMLYENEVLQEVLQPGFHMFWKFARKLRLNTVDTRWEIVDVSGQEILTKDRVSLRVNLSATYKVVDPIMLENSVQRLDTYLYRELQLALRQAVGTRTLDELLVNKTALDSMISEGVDASLKGIGIEMGSIGVKDIILPGEMKDILNQVVLAEKNAQANNIRRREETAATRSLMNTAKLMADNPLLVRLKELEALEKVTTNIDRITVFGGMDGVMQDLVKIDQRD